MNDVQFWIERIIEIAREKEIDLRTVTEKEILSLWEEAEQREMTKRQRYAKNIKSGS